MKKHRESARPSLGAADRLINHESSTVTATINETLLQYSNGVFTRAELAVFVILLLYKEQDYAGSWPLLPPWLQEELRAWSTDVKEDASEYWSPTGRTPANYHAALLSLSKWLSSSAGIDDGSARPGDSKFGDGLTE